MQIKHIAAAVAAALVAPAAMAASISATNIVYVSGATAQTPALAKSAQAFCNSTVLTYTDATDGKSGFAYLCSNAKSTSGFAVSSTFLIVKNEGGSSQGVAPVVNKTSVTFLDITSCTNTTAMIAGSNTSDIVGTFSGTCANTASLVPQVGFSDVPAAVWTARGAFTPSTTAYTNVAGFAGQGFGVAASASLYTALQQDQVNAGFLAAGCVNSTTLACQPSISKEQYAAIVTNSPGNEYQVDWSSLLNHSTLGGANLPAATDVVSLCRRSNGSGTQASSDIYFLNTPCEANTKFGGAAVAIGAGVYDAAGTPSTDTANYSGTAAFHVQELGSTGAVKTCLLSSTEPYALGVMSLENAQPATGWKWLRINGATPNADTFQKATVVDGSYDFAFETEMLYRNDVAANAKAFATKVVAELGNGANLSSFYGVYADPTSGATFVAGQTHKGSRGNNVCAAHILSY